MQSFPLSFFIEGQFLGESIFTPRRTGLAGLPFSRAWYCWKCGRVWAQAVMEKGRCEYQRSLCERCEYRSIEQSAITLPLIPGSIWPEFYQDDFIAALPPTVLSREASLHLHHFDRFVNLDDRKA